MMRLSEAEVKKITKGALLVQIRDGRYQFYRFPESELERLKDQADHYKKMRASSGIRFDLVTDAESITFQYCVYKASSRNFYYFDICVDGELYSHIGQEGVEESSGEVHAVLPGGVHRVTVYFPCLFRVSVWDVELTGGNGRIGTVEYKQKLLSLGDSITQGYDARFPSFAYPSRLADYFEGEYINQGVGSDVFNAEHLSTANNYSPDIITVAYGTNDWSLKTSLAEFEEECWEYMERLKLIYPGKKVIVITPLWRKTGGRISPVGTLNQVRDKIVSIWKSYPYVFLVDGQKLVPHLPEFFDDGALHPNDMGFILYAGNLIDELKKRGK